MAAVFMSMKCEDVWMRYVKDFFSIKLNLSSESFAKSVSVLSSQSFTKSVSVEKHLIAHGDGNMHRRITDLHVFVRLYHLDSESLSLMRVLDELQKKYQAIPEEQCHISILQKPEVLFGVVIEAIHNVLVVISLSMSPCKHYVDDLRKLSSHYLQVVSIIYHGISKCA